MKINNIYRRIQNKKRGFRRKNIGFTGAFYAVILPFALCAGFFLTAVLTPAGGALDRIFAGFIVNGSPSLAPESALRVLLHGAFPQLGGGGGEPSPAAVKSGAIVLGADENSHSAPETAVNDLPITEIYEYYTSVSGVKIEEAERFSGEIPEGSGEIRPVNLSGQKELVPKLLIINQTSFSVDLEDYLLKSYPITDCDPALGEPVVLILCTHATESYVGEGEYFYSPLFGAERHEEIDKNVVSIASRLKETLEKNGIPAIQSTTLHDAEAFKDSYKRSLETMQALKAEYPSIRYIIDVHRDSIILDSGLKYNPVISIDGKRTAQMMMVVGTSDGGASHPDWQDNLTFAVRLQDKLNAKYPMLMRPINLRSPRFNQHTAKGAIILEVGSCGSSFSEALNAAELFGRSLAELIIENSPG